MKAKDELRVLEKEIWEDYQTFRGIPAVKNSFTEARWRRVEELIAEVER